MNVPVLTAEQRRVIDFMCRRGLASLVYWVRDEFPVTITVEDFKRSEPLSEIFAAKITLYEQGDETQRFQRKGTRA
jgi:hypothetical protein